jgi:hypothetical protein
MTFFHQAALSTLLNEGPLRARVQILQHVTEIKMSPVPAGKESYYVAEGEWDLLGNAARKAKVTGAMLNGDFRNVAGEGFEPSTFGL